MRLTERQRQILEGLRDDPEADLVEEGGQVWFGLERSNVATVNFFLRNCLVHQEQCDATNRYTINEWGRRALDDPDFEPQDELVKLMARAERAGKEIE